MPCLHLAGQLGQDFDVGIWEKTPIVFNGLVGQLSQLRIPEIRTNKRTFMNRSIMFETSVYCITSRAAHDTRAENLFDVSTLGKGATAVLGLVLPQMPSYQESMVSSTPYERRFQG